MSDDFYYRPPGPKRPPHARPLSAQAQARLAAIADELPRRGDEITIRWPGGAHDFVMFFEREQLPRPPRPGWHYLAGRIVEPNSWYPGWFTPMARLVDGVWTMLPVDGRVTADGTVVPIG